MISLLIVAYLAIATLQVLPDSSFKESCLGFAGPWVSSFGLFQRWNLFSPELRALNFYGSCLVEYEDGSLRLYEWPRNERLSVLNRLINQKVRRFVIDSWTQLKYRDFWPDGAWFIARATADGDNPTSMVELYFESFTIPRPNSQRFKRDAMPGYFRTPVFVTRELPARRGE